MLPHTMKSVSVLLLAFGLLAGGRDQRKHRPAWTRRATRSPTRPFLGSVQHACATAATSKGWLFSPDGKTLISDGRDGVNVWDVVTGKQLRHLHNERGRGLREMFSLSPDGKQIAVPFDGAIRLLEVNTDEEVRSFGAQAAVYGALRFSPDGKKLAALCSVEDETNRNNELRQSYMQRLEIWEAATGLKVSSQNLGTGHSSLLGWADEKTPILVNYSGDKLRLWDADAGEFKHQFVVGELTAEGGRIAFSPAGGLLAVICDDRRTRCVRIWNVATGKQTQQLGAYVIRTEQWSGVPSKYLTVVAFDWDGKTLVTNSEDGTLIFWDATTGAEVRRFPHGLPGAQRWPYRWTEKPWPAPAAIPSACST